MAESTRAGAKSSPTSLSPLKTCSLPLYFCFQLHLYAYRCPNNNKANSATHLARLLCQRPNKQLTTDRSQRANKQSAVRQICCRYSYVCLLRSCERFISALFVMYINSFFGNFSACWFFTSQPPPKFARPLCVLFILQLCTCKHTHIYI